MIKLYDYQENAIANIYSKWQEDRKIILWAMMGSGKSEMASYIAKDAAKDGVPVLLVVRGRPLVNNLSARLDKYKIDHSVFMAKHHRFDRTKMIQVCSIDTLISRKEFPFSDRQAIIILDEAHKDYSVIFEKYPTQYILGLTATPHSDMSDYSDYVCPIEPTELVANGVLVIDEIFCPHVIDTSSLKIVAGDFKRDQLAKLVTEGEIVGNVIQDYIQYGENRPAVCFAVNIEHSKQLRDEFNKQGVSAIHCDANSSDEERKKAQEDLESGRIKVLCNVDIFSVGWDCPMVSCIILARPTWSLIWYLQAIGRGLRSFPGKTKCIILDNAGNVYRHGTAYRPRSISLEKPKKGAKKVKGDVTVATCKECLRVYATPAECCPYCGYEAPSREIRNVDGVLSKYKESEDETRERKIKEAQIQFIKLKWVAQKKGLTDQWIRNQIEKKYGSVVMPYIEELFKIRSR
jgi:DNA repair protein RadD